KAIGGTNWGYIGSTDTYTSYDFGAPISESGINTERLSETKTINYFLQSFDLSATDRVEDSSLGFQNNDVNGPNCLYAIRKPIEGSSKDVILPESQWLFFRNLTESNQTGLLTGASLKLPQSIELRPHEVAILPYYIPLKNGHTLLSSSVEPVYQTDSYIILKGDRPISVQIELKGLDNSTLNVHYLHYEHSTVICNIHSEQGKPHLIHISGPTLAPKGYEQIRVGGITVYFLGSHWVDKMWLLEDGYTVFGPDERLVSGEYGFRNPSDLSLSISPHGEFSKIENSSAEKPKLLLPELKHWKVTHEAPELYLEGHYQPISPRGADFDVNGFYEGSAWYRYPLGDKRPESLLVNARHIWGAFINGHFVGEGHHWQLFDDNPSPGPQKIIIPPEVYESKGPKNLVIFVDGLGHPKGFHDDARQAQGLLLLKVDDEDITNQVEISAGLSCWKAPIAQALGFIPKTSPLVKLETHFTLPSLEEVHAPLGLSINHLKYERVNIYLNGVLVGRHWQACQNQTLYYLPESLLKGMEQGANTLELILMNFSPLISLEHCIPGPQDVTLQAYDVFTKITI
ncbi:MAG: beta-galactosidase, partial [Cyanobacteria bacterium]|nr:beta-galactosidase [Cyanobacteriota bacterium]